MALHGATLQQALDQLLTPMGLTYRVCDETTLEITSDAALALRPELEFYAVGDIIRQAADGGMDGQKIVERVLHKLEGQIDSSGDVGAAFDQPSQCLLVLVPQPQQRLVARMLAEWRAPRLNDPAVVSSYTLRPCAK